MRGVQECKHAASLDKLLSPNAVLEKAVNALSGIECSTSVSCMQWYDDHLVDKMNWNYQTRTSARAQSTLIWQFSQCWTSVDFANGDCSSRIPVLTCLVRRLYTYSRFYSLINIILDNAGISNQSMQSTDRSNIRGLSPSFTRATSTLCLTFSSSDETSYRRGLAFRLRSYLEN